MKYLGCAYYPEYWGKERVAVDAKLMRAAGINIVRIGEFAWSRMEPAEGQFTLDWLHECISVLDKHGIQVLMCTPTPTPPAWLTTAYPEVLLVRGDGTRVAHGSRRHYCTTSDSYRRHTARIADVLSRELAPHRNVVAWQLDNEFGPEAGWCHCENCQTRFQQWLQQRYGSVPALNSAWKTGFWSVDFTDWRQVRLDDGRVEMYAAQKLDSHRFWSEMMVDYARSQADIIRRNHPRALVTTNGMGPIFSPINYYRLFDFLDVACDDLYFDIATMDANAAAMNIYRQIKPNQRYWITETGSGALDHGKPPHPDQFRAWAWSSWAHGADAHFIFRWRTCLSGQEQELQGILEHSGKPRHRYDAVKRCFTEITALREELADLPLPQAPVAILQDYESMWGYEAARIGRDVDYQGLIYRLHRQLYDRSIMADIIPPERDLSGYQLVILPSLVMLEPATAKRLEAFVKQGGTVLGIGQLGMRDRNDNYLEEPGPAHLQKLFGLTLEGGMYLHSFVGPDEALWVPKAAKGQVDVPMTGKLAGKAVAGVGKTWIADIAPRDAEVLLTFAAEAYARQPALTCRKTGKGAAFYLGTVLTDEAFETTLMGHVLKTAGVAAGPTTPRHVEIIRRGNVLFAINHTAQPVSVPLPGLKGRALVGSFTRGKAVLPAYGVTVLRLG